MNKGVVSMGAYGSPELWSPDSERYSPVSCNRQYDVPPPKHHLNGGLTFFIGVAVGALIFYSVSFLGNISKKVTVPAVASASVAVVSDSDDYLQSWAKTAVLKGLLYPDSAKFSSNSSDWKIVRNGDTCEINSIVTAKGKSGTSGTTTFTVRLNYYDLNAQVTYLKIGNKVVYDVSE